MTYGYTLDTEGNITGEQDVLRYSAFDCWLKSKDAYRKRYYEGQSFQTAEMVYGHKIHKAIEKGETVLPGLLRYEAPEYNIEQYLDKRVKIGGCLDTFDPKTFAFADYKSSHRNKDGKAPWDKVKVSKHMQLVFYSILVELKHGKVDPWVHLIWLETEFKGQTKEFAGHTLTSSQKELCLTGEYKIFPRRIAKWEKMLLRKRIKKAAKEISEDFILYKKSK